MEERDVRIASPGRRASCETRSKLLDVAICLMSKHSFAAVSVDDICREAGVKKGSFYHFFSSKAELAVASISEYAKCSQPALDSAFSPAKAPVQRLKDFCDLNLQEQKKKVEALGRVCGCPLTTLGSELTEAGDEVQCAASKLGATLLHYLESTIADGVRLGEIASCDAKCRAEELHTIVIGAATRARIQNSLQPLELMWPMMAAILRLP